MVDETETPKILEELSKKNTAQARPRADSRKRAAMRRLVLFVLALSPLLLGLVFLGYQQWSLRLTLDRMARENSRLQDTIDLNVARIAELETVSAQPTPLPTVDASDLDDVREELNARMQRLNNLLAELQSRTGVETGIDDDRWRLAEAEHLLRMANQQLQLGKDVSTTINLLQLADQLLVESDDTRVVQARQTLLQEIGELRAVEAVDQQGIYLRLGNLREMVATIEIAGSAQDEYRHRLAGQTGAMPAPAADGNQSLLDSGLAFLGSVFVWRQWEDRPEIMNPPQELLSIKQNINLMLEQAQVALMTGQAGIYRTSLTRAREWISSYLSGLSDITPRLLAEVDALLAEQLEPELPDISVSLRQLRQIRASSTDAVASPL